MASNMLLPELTVTGCLALFVGVLDEFFEQFLKELGGMAGEQLAVFLASGAMADVQGLLGAGDGHVKEPPFFIQGAFHFGTRVRQQAFLQSDDKNMGKLQALATVHGDQGHGVAGSLFFLLTFAVQR